MPLSTLGVFHTVIGIAALLSLAYSLWQYKQIRLDRLMGRVYLFTTVLTGASALGIYKNDEPNIAHGLAALTILAVVLGCVATKVRVFGGYQKYFIALCFSSTALFHMLPTVTEILTRFPSDAPMVTTLEDPLLTNAFMVVLVSFVVLLGLQMNWLRKQAE
ncbi:MAG: putative membrane protein [Halioglobus sp.]|jgi:uncharacterized membrane protein